MPRLWNRKSPLRPPADHWPVYIGRPTKWGNPFEIGVHGTRQEVIAQFRDWVYKPEQAQLREDARQVLRGKDLVCWCYPADCHGSIWLEIANG